MKYQAPTGSVDPNAPYVGKNPALGIQGSRVPPLAIEQPLREIMAVIEAAGLTGSDSDLQQLLRAVRSQRANFVAAASVAGSANSITLAFSPTFPALGDLVATPLVFLAEAANTGAVTIAVDGLAAQPLTWPDGTALAAGDITSGRLIVVRHDGAGFRMMAPLSPTQVRAMLRVSRSSQFFSYTTSGIWTPPANWSHSIFELRGAGGSGAVDSSSLGTMGSAGGIVRFKRENTDILAPVAYTIGLGGAAVGSGVAANGNAGGSTTFVGAVAAGGGGGWTGNTSAVPGVNNLNGLPGVEYQGFPVGNQVAVQATHGMGYFGYGGRGGQVGVLASVAGGNGIIIEERFFLS